MLFAAVASTEVQGEGERQDGIGRSRREEEWECCGKRTAGKQESGCFIWSGTKQALKALSIAT